MEWIVIDDGEDSVEDLFKDVECVKYFRYEEKLKLGRKRNLMHEKVVEKYWFIWMTTIIIHQNALITL